MNDKIESCNTFDEKYVAIDIIRQPFRFDLPCSRIRRRVVDIIKGRKSIADLGCGHGGSIYRFHKMNPTAAITGYDYSEVAVRKAKELFGNENISFIRLDFDIDPLPEKIFDLIYCTQVVEHVKSDGNFLDKIANALLDDGILVLTTVYKKSWAWYFYRNAKGVTVVDPTHKREYTNIRSFLDLIEERNLMIIDHDINLVKYPLIDVFLKLLTRHFKNKVVYCLVNSFVVMLLRICLILPIPGYYNFQILACKKGDVSCRKS